MESKSRRQLLVYKNDVSVSSQVFFCAAPIRLDAYNSCEFACTYCFSRRRSKMTASKGVKSANNSAFAARLKRIQNGRTASALDEFLEKKVPLQLGGLHDPFTNRENEYGVTLSLLTTLADHEYPTLISTKSDLPGSASYLSILKSMNVLMRFSAAAVPDVARPEIDRRCPDFNNILRVIERLSNEGVRTAVRLQPVFPGCEQDAFRMTRQAAMAGALQVSFEYLKLPKELTDREHLSMNKALGFDLQERMKAIGLRGVGPDVTLVSEAKRPFLIEAQSLCHELGIRFGAGDTEFIPWSDGTGCCGSSDLLLGNAHQFAGNLTGLIKSARYSKRRTIKFSELSTAWSPSHSIGNYLDSRSRQKLREDADLSNWMQLLGARWNGGHSPYSPDFFDGVSWQGEYDQTGDKIYHIDQELDRQSSLSRP